MNAQVQRLLDEVRRLSDEDLSEFIEAFHEEFEEVDKSSQEDDPLWDAEIAKRVAEADSGEAPAIPWEEARQQMFGTNEKSSLD